jgi:hypothetical protein
MAEEAKESVWSDLGFGAYFGGGCAILQLVFVDAFSLSVPVAFTLAVFLTSLGAYPIFIRGTEIRRKFLFLRGKRWTFLQWFILSTMFTLIAMLIDILFLSHGK